MSQQQQQQQQPGIIDLRIMLAQARRGAPSGEGRGQDDRRVDPTRDYAGDRKQRPT